MGNPKATRSVVGLMLLRNGGISGPLGAAEDETIHDTLARLTHGPTRQAHGPRRPLALRCESIEADTVCLARQLEDEARALWARLYI